MDENIPININNNAEVPTEFNYPKMNLIQRIIGVIFSPGKVMQVLEQKPRILFALLLTILTPIIMIYSIFPMYTEYSRNILETSYPDWSTQQIEQALNIAKISGPIFGALGVVAMWFLGALVLWIIIKIFKGEGSYKQILSITGYAAVITTLGTIASIITTQFTGAFSEISYTSIASLLPDMKGNFFYGVAKALDVFSIWHYVVIAIGTATVSKMNKKKAYLIVACIFVITVIYAGVMEARVAGIM